MIYGLLIEQKYIVVHCTNIKRINVELRTEYAMNLLPIQDQALVGRFGQAQDILYYMV